MKILICLMALSFSTYIMAQDMADEPPTEDSQELFASDEISPSYEEPVFESEAIEAAPLKEEQEFSSEDLKEEWSSSNDIVDEESYIE